ncbi:MAG: CPXCG motif-containing cysteine-rich protein [Planctomycetia bacterium]
MSIHGGSTTGSRRHKKRRRKKKPAAALEATSICDSCGEEIVVPVDISAGSQQDYVEDYPVCCHPMTLHVEIDYVQPGQWHLRTGLPADERLVSLGTS